MYHKNIHNRTELPVCFTSFILFIFRGLEQGHIKKYFALQYVLMRDLNKGIK